MLLRIATWPSFEIMINENGFAWNAAKKAHVLNLGKTLEIDYKTDQAD